MGRGSLTTGMPDQAAAISRGECPLSAWSVRTGVLCRMGRFPDAARLGVVSLGPVVSELRRGVPGATQTARGPVVAAHSRAPSGSPTAPPRPRPGSRPTHHDASPRGGRGTDARGCRYSSRRHAPHPRCGPDRNGSQAPDTPVLGSAHPLRASAAESRRSAHTVPPATRPFTSHRDPLSVLLPRTDREPSRGLRVDHSVPHQLPDPRQ